MLLPRLLQKKIPVLARKSVLQAVHFHSHRNVYACNVEICVLFRAGNTEAARKLFDEMPTKDVVSWNSMITGYWKNGYIGESKILFESMPLRNIVSWNSMISGSIENDRIDDAHAYFSRVPEKNIASCNAMISGFVSGYVENERYSDARELFDRMPEKNLVTMTAMISGYCKEGKMVDARILFDEIQCKDCVSFNAMIAGYSQHGSGEEAVKLYIYMLRNALKPDYLTYVSVLTACSNLASLKEGKQMHTLLLKHRLDSHVPVCNALITMYSKGGSVIDSESAFGHITNPNLVSWNTIIAAFAQHGLYEKALTLFRKLQVDGFQPDERTFLSLFSACGHAGMVKESLDWFDSMTRNYKIAPRSEHYACLVDILGRSGQVEKAYKMIQEMPFEADSGVWGALLAGCRSCLNVELGEIAAKKMVELDGKNSGPYVMLSNIYAACGFWKEVTRVRGLMNNNGIKKQPAYSWTEIDNKVHYFLGGDVSHPAIEEIHSEVNQISLQMKAILDITDIISAWSCFNEMHACECT